MKLLESYGRALAYYEGAIAIDETEGYFEAIQAVDGTIAIACFFNKAVLIDVGATKPQFKAVSTDGWEIVPYKDTFVKNRNFAMRQGTTTTTVTLLPIGLRCKRFPYLDSQSPNIIGARFAVANLLFGQSSTTMPQPIQLSVEGRNVEIRPTETYLGKAGQLTAIPGIAHTAWVEIRGSGEAGHFLDEDVALMDDLISTFRLWSGNKLDWLFGEGTNYSSERPMEILHKNGVIGNFSNIHRSYGWEIDLAELIRAFFSMTDSNAMDRQTAKELIAYYTDCCAKGPYIETRALSAATLLDVLTLKHAEASGKENVMPKDTFEHDPLPKLKETIDSTALEISIKEQLKNNAQGLYRTSFRRRLRLLNDELNLGMDGSLIQRVIDARDSLVHEGRFPDEDRESWHPDYQRLLWADFVALCRLIGYKGNLPPAPAVK